MMRMGRKVRGKHTISIIKLGNEISEIGKNKQRENEENHYAPFLDARVEGKVSSDRELATKKIHKKILILLHQFTIYNEFFVK